MGKSTWIGGAYTFGEGRPSTCGQQNQAAFRSLIGGILGTSRKLRGEVVRVRREERRVVPAGERPAPAKVVPVGWLSQRSWRQQSLSVVL